MTLIQVPAAGAGDHGGEFVGGLQCVGLARHGVGEVDAALVGVDQIELAEDDVLPRGGGRVLEVGEPDPGARVQSVDGHLAVGRTGDLHPSVVQRGRGRGDLPGVVRADRRRLGQEVQRGGAGDLGAALAAAGEQLVATRRELPVQLGHEREGRVGQDLVLPGQGLGIDDGRRGRRWCGHERSLLQRAVRRCGSAGGGSAAARAARNGTACQGSGIRLREPSGLQSASDQWIVVSLWWKFNGLLMSRLSVPTEREPAGAACQGLVQRVPPEPPGPLIRGVSDPRPYRCRTPPPHRNTRRA